MSSHDFCFCFWLSSAVFGASFQELGACPPLGYWDPFGMMAFQDEAKFRRNRELELKHGRICTSEATGLKRLGIA